MSRSNPEINQNPTTRYFEWDGENGGVKYYDKEREENDRTVHVKMPFTFLFLDQLSKITGWNDNAGKNVYSNEVKWTNESPFTVRVDKHTIAQGLYGDIKNDVKAQGGRFTSSVYIAYKDGDEMKIGNISFRGAALSEWMDFMKSNQKGVHEKAVKVDVHPEIFKKGKTEYRIPTFSIQDTKPETDEQAKELDATLQMYLRAKPDYKPETPNETSSVDAGESAYDASVKASSDGTELDNDVDDDLPF